MEEKVKSEFLQTRPEFEVLSTIVGEGDSSAAYCHIRYKRPNEAQVYEVVWQYLKDRNGVWTLSHQDSPRRLD